MPLQARVCRTPQNLDPAAAPGWAFRLTNDRRANAMAYLVRVQEDEALVV